MYYFNTNDQFYYLKMEKWIYNYNDARYMYIKLLPNC